MKWHIAIVEDDASEREGLRTLLEELSVSLKTAFCITAFSSAEAFLFEHENQNIYDLLLLDVEMGAVSGIDLAKHIRTTDRRVQIVFITSHVEFMGEGYEVDARHFLVKPVKPEKLQEVLSRAISHLSVEPPSIRIKQDGELVKLATDSILYVEALLHYLVIHTTAGDYRIKESLTAFSRRLDNSFFKIHRSYIVALSRIIRISRAEVVLDTGVRLPLARGLYDAVNRAFIEQN